MDARTHLLNRLDDANDPKNARPLVTLEEYFDGNNDHSSIGDVRTRIFSPPEFFAVLRELRERDDVHDIRIELKLPKAADGWPSTDTVWIVTSLSRSDLPRCGLSPDFWERFLPDDWLSFPRLDGHMTEPLKIPDGMRAFGFYYY